MNFYQMLCLCIIGMCLLSWVIFVWSSNSLGNLANRWDRQRFTKRAVLELKSCFPVQKQISYLRRIDPDLFKELVHLAFIQCRIGAEQEASYFSSSSSEFELTGIEGGKVVVRFSQSHFRPKQAEMVAFEANYLTQAAQGYYVYLGASPLRLVHQLAINDSVRLISGSRFVKMLVQGKSNWMLSLPSQAPISE